jgi:cyclohexadieny/prephenate dehydrogenase
MRFDQITIVGVGLIGGSVGLAAKARGVAARVVGVGRDAGNLSRAVELGAIDSYSLDLADAVKTADLVVVCTPVDRIAEVIRAAAPHVRPGAIFTDAGSTKGNILADLRGVTGLIYIPAHPLAGAEKNGVAHAHPDLFENRVTILTPDFGQGNLDAVSRVEALWAALGVEAFWAALGSRVVRMSAAEHDRVLATTSHLPHAVAASVAGITPTDWLPLTAGGFRDVTRIAAGDPELWAAIFEANREAVLAALATFTDRLNEFRSLLEAGDGAGLVRWLSEAKQVRDALGS